MKKIIVSLVFLFSINLVGFCQIGKIQSLLGIDTLKSTQRSFAKKGALQATNNNNVSISDTTYRLGATNFGANYATLPYNSNYTIQTQGNTRIVGTGVFDYLQNKNTDLIIMVDLLNGVDGLEPSQYYAGASFLTLNNALLFAIKDVRFAQTTFNILNSSATNRAKITAGLPNIVGKYWTFNSGFIDIQAAITFITGYYQFQPSIDLFVSSSSYVGIYSKYATIYMNNGQVTLDADYHRVFYATTLGHLILSATKLTYGADNQAMFAQDANYTNATISIQGSSTYINTSTFINCKLVSSIINATNGVLTILTGLTYVFPSTLNVARCKIIRANTEIIGQTTDDSSWRFYKEVLYGTTPIRTPDMNSGTAGNYKPVVVDGTGVFSAQVLTWTTATRPTTPYIGQDGFNSTLSQKEYWTGSLWKAY